MTSDFEANTAMVMLQIIKFEQKE